MYLKSFGCSFIFGTDLHDDGKEKICPTPSRHTWPALIAQHLGHEYVCYARPGSGNLRIWTRMTNHVISNEPDLFVVQWTWGDRFDYIDSDRHDKANNLDPHMYQAWSYDPWKTLMPNDFSNDNSEWYFRNLHTQTRDQLTNLIYIKSAIDLLKASGNKFIMFNMDDLLFENRWHATPAITALQEMVRPYLNSFEGKNFLEWSHDRGYPISATKHPLEEAHRAAADYIIYNWDQVIRG